MVSFLKRLIIKELLVVEMWIGLLKAGPDRNPDAASLSK